MVTVFHPTIPRTLNCNGCSAWARTMSNVRAAHGWWSNFSSLRCSELNALCACFRCNCLLSLFAFLIRSRSLLSLSQSVTLENSFFKREASQCRPQSLRLSTVYTHPTVITSVISDKIDTILSALKLLHLLLYFLTTFEVPIFKGVTAFHCESSISRIFAFPC